MLGLFLYSCESELVGASNFFRLHGSHLKCECIFNYSLSLDKEVSSYLHPRLTAEVHLQYGISPPEVHGISK